MSHTVWAAGYLNPCPPDDLIGWCHTCETWQRGRDKTVAIVKTRHGVGFSFGCTNGCHMEAWDMGIWSCPCPDHIAWEDEDREAFLRERAIGRVAAGLDPEPDDQPCWDDLYADRADHQCESYISEACPHADQPPERVRPVDRPRG